MTDLKQYARNTAEKAHRASQELRMVTGAQKEAWLRATAEALQSDTDALIEANRQDIAKAPEYGLSAAAIDRLRLTPARLQQMTQALEQIALLPEPIGEVIDSSVRPNGLLVTRVRVPLGVVFFIYESRPNVTVDAAALCVKSGNAVILRGGKEAFHSNCALHNLLQKTLEQSELPTHAVQLVETTDREAVGHFLKLNDQIDVTIPRGGKSLIQRVAAEATMPVIKHYDGICHVYVDRSADPEMAKSIVVNSKCQRPGVCNAAESLLVDAAVAETVLPSICEGLRSRGVQFRCCERSHAIITDSQLATDDDFRAEYLDLIISVKVVDSLNDAISHIDTYGSGHTETIVANDVGKTEQFLKAVDSSAVMVNASTRFNDGGEFGLGAEIGISTDKFHARGPCGLRELTSYKFVVRGSGQIRT